MAKLQHRVAAWLAAVLLTLSLPAFAVQRYDIRVDTATLLGSDGYLDFQFNPGSVPASAATAIVSDVTGVTWRPDAPTVEGSVTGNLPGTLTFGNSTILNAYLTPVSFGSLFSFSLVLDGIIGSGAATAFSLALLDNAYNPQLTTDPEGRVLTLNRYPDGVIAIATYDRDATGAPSVVSVTAIPEPPVVLLLGAGLGLLGIVLRRCLVSMPRWIVLQTWIQTSSSIL